MVDTTSQEDVLTADDLAKVRDEAANEIFGDGKKSDAAGYEPPAGDDDFVDVSQDRSQNDDSGDEDVDPYAGVSPALRAHIEALGGRLKQSEKRVGSLQNALTNAQVQNKQAQETARLAKEAKDNEPTADEIAAAAESDKEWNELIEEFPEWGKAIGGKLEAEAKEWAKERKVFEGRIKVLEAKSGTEDGVSQLEIDKLKVSIKHPDWENTILTDDWKAFAATLPPEEQAKLSSFDPQEAIHVLNLFEDRQKIKGQGTKNTKKDKLAAASTPRRTGGKRIGINKSPDEMSEAEYRDFAASEVWADD